MTINAKTEFDLVGDGRDESEKLLQAFDLAKTGEDLYFAPGIYGHSCSFDPVNVFGAGREITIFRRLSDVPSFRFYGRSMSERNIDSSVRNLSLHGNDFQSPLIDMVHASHFSLDNVKLFAVVGIGLHMTEVWDSEFRNLYGNWLGGNTTPAVYINSSRAAQGFGYSTDNSNQIKFYNLHLEYVRGGGIKIDPGVSQRGPNGIWITDLKIESPISTGPLVEFGVHCDRVYLRNAYLWIADTATGRPLRAAIVNNATGSSSMSHVFIGNADKRTLEQGIIMNTSKSPSGGIAILDVIEGRYGVKPNNHIQVLGSNSKSVRTNIFSN